MTLKMDSRGVSGNRPEWSEGGLKRVVQMVVHLCPFSMESKIPMLLIQLDTDVSLEFLRGPKVP
jgi:hypothetical protein